MTGIDPLKDIPGVKEFQERIMVRAVRLTRDNGEEIARRARKVFGFTHEGWVILTDHDGTLWAVEGDMIVTVPGGGRVSCRIPEDFRARYTHPGAPIVEEDLA